MCSLAPLRKQWPVPVQIATSTVIGLTASPGYSSWLHGLNEVPLSDIIGVIHVLRAGVGTVPCEECYSFWKEHMHTWARPAR